MIEEKVVEMQEYAEDMADRYNEKGDMYNYNYWKGKATAYQNVLDILRENRR